MSNSESYIIVSIKEFGFEHVEEHTNTKVESIVKNGRYFYISLSIAQDILIKIDHKDNDLIRKGSKVTISPMEMSNTNFTLTIETFPKSDKTEEPSKTRSSPNFGFSKIGNEF